MTRTNATEFDIGPALRLLSPGAGGRSTTGTAVGVRGEDSVASTSPCSPTPTGNCARCMPGNDVRDVARDSQCRQADDNTETFPAADSGRLLHTPAEAARILAIKESWLRRKAGTRAIPSTLVGKHLRFSDADLSGIVDHFRRPARTSAQRSVRRRKPIRAPQRMDSDMR